MSSLKLKIAILSSGAGFVERGVEIVARELYERLDGEVRVFGLGDTSWVEKVWGMRRDSSPYKFYLRINRGFFDDYDLEVLSFMLGALLPLKRFDPDIILNLNGPIAGRFCSIFRHLYGIPFITAAQGGSLQANGKTKPDAFVVLTPQAKHLMEKMFPELKVFIIPNGINIDIFKMNEQKYSEKDLIERCRIPGTVIRHPIVLSTSALETPKRIDLLINAMERTGHGTLVLAGDGVLREKLIVQARIKLGRRFIYLGRVPYTELPVLYRSCDVFCLPSESEAFGNVLLEAMACGLPVVSQDDENRRWILGEYGGVLANLSDIEAFAKAIETAYKKGFDKRALEHVKQFSWDIVAKQYMDLIYRLVKNERI